MISDSIHDRSVFNTPQEHEIFGDRDFPSWLTQQQISLACTTYQTSRLMLIGVVPETSGMMVIDLTNGAIVHWLRFEGIVTELYDVQVIPQVQKPMALGFQTDEIAQLITLEL